MNNFNECGNVSEKLKSLKGVIIDEWLKESHECHHRPSGKNEVMLENHISEIIEELIDVLNKRGENLELEAGEAHGFQRAILTDFSLLDIIEEFKVLRRVIVAYLYPMGDLSAPPVVHGYLDSMIKNSVEQYLKTKTSFQS